MGGVVGCLGRVKLRFIWHFRILRSDDEAGDSNIDSVPGRGRKVFRFT